MSIRLRITLLMLVLFALYGGLDLAIRMHYVWPSFTQWEQQAAMDAATRFEQRIEHELNDLDHETRNWSRFDPLIAFTRGQNPGFVDRHLNQELFEHSDNNLIAVYDATGKSLVQRFDRPVSADLLQQLTPRQISAIHRLRVFDDNQPAIEQRSSGLLITTRGPWLMSARPLIDPGQQSAVGIIVLGRKLSSERVVGYSRELRTALLMDWHADVAPIEGSGYAHGSLNQRFTEQADRQLRATRIMVSADGHAELELSAQIDRNGIRQGFDRAQRAWLYAAGSGFVMLLILGWLLNRSLVQPIKSLSQLMQRVVDKGDYSLRPRLRRSDEIGQLANVFEEMMNRVEGQHAAKNLQSQRLQKLAGTDALTGVANRRALEEYLEQSWSRSRQQQLPMSVILCDIDHFKLYNDHYGHLDGDKCLRSVAEALNGQLHRKMDMVFRYGGEEFAVVLPATDLEGAVKLAEKLRTAVMRRNLAHAKTEPGIVTLSLGVAAAIGGEAPSHLLLDAADRALYESKEAGRNRVSASSPISVAHQSRRKTDDHPASA